MHYMQSVQMSLMWSLIPATVICETYKAYLIENYYNLIILVIFTVIN